MFQFVVPARKGSKGIPDKNLQCIYEDCELCWLALCLANDCSDRDVIFSTDYPLVDLTFRNVINHRPDKIRFISRPPNLATDDALMVDVLRHLVDDGHVEDGVEALVVLQPTNPFRTADLVRQCCRKYIEQGRTSMVTVKPVSQHPGRMYYRSRKHLKSLLGQQFGYNSNRQQLTDVFIRDGAVYISSVEPLRRGHQYGHRRGFVIREDEININIDTRLDLILARAVWDEWSSSHA